MGYANNYFGIKAQVRNGKIEFGDVASGYVDKITKEYDKNGRAYTVVAHFRRYKSMADVSRPWDIPDKGHRSEIKGRR